MRLYFAEWLHRHMPFRVIGSRANNALARWAWSVAPDPEAPASVQAWWMKGGEGTNHPPPRLRARKQAPERFAPFGPGHDGPPE